MRLKKQEEKRQRRFGAKQEDGTTEGKGVDAEGQLVDAEGAELESEQPEGATSESGPPEIESKVAEEK